MRAHSRAALGALLLWIAWSGADALIGWAGVESPSETTRSALAQSIDAVGMTVANMDRSVMFFRDVLTFEKVSDVELAGEEYERLQGVFGLRMRVVRMRLGG